MQGLLENINQRFPDENLLAAGAVLDPDSWPNDDVKKIFFGDQDVMRLAQLCGVDQASVVNEFRHYKQNVKKVGPALKQLLHRLQLLPISSAECERGFSAMNLDDTSIRNRLQIPTMNALVFIKVNGPTETNFQVCLKIMFCLISLSMDIFVFRLALMLKSGSRVGDILQSTSLLAKRSRNKKLPHLCLNYFSEIKI